MDMKSIDQATITNTPISSIDLMEKAGLQCFKAILKHYPNQNHFSVFCGMGNNGGDGLVIARKLLEAGKNVEVFILQFREKGSEEFEENLKRLKTKPYTLNTEQHDFNLKTNTIVIDAILGVGLRRPVNNWLANVIEQLNAQQLTVIGIDLPSGLFSEFNNENKGAVVKCTNTFYIGAPKLALFLPDYGNSVGQIDFIDIDLDVIALKKAKSNYYLLTKSTIQNILKNRSKHSHKGTFGHATLIGGSLGKMGAILLSAKSALKSGAGLVSTVVPKCGVNILQTALPEAMAQENIGKVELKGSIKIDSKQTYGIGPGMGISPDTQDFFEAFLHQIKRPIVLDADGLNCFSTNKKLYEKIPHNSILTPHPKEFERLVGKFDNDAEKLNKLKEFSAHYNVIVVLKGAHTAICTPKGEIYFNSTGNPGMATGGSGDILTGIITGLLAQNYTPLNASILGVYLHGLAGDFALIHESEESLIASDIITHLSQAWMSLKS